MNFFIFDISFLVIFSLFVIFFLYKTRKKLKREGVFFMYRTKIGIKFIDYIGKRYKKAIKVIQYFSITIGYLLMAGILYLAVTAVYGYVRYPQLRQAMGNSPPIVPVIPYFPMIFGLQSFFPNFYFTYFLIAILVVATVHEFAHGIIAKAKGLRIKSTGFVFLGPIIGAFVEPDEKAMFKKKKVEQLAILSAGVFANVITAAIFFLILYLFFISSFMASGVIVAPSFTVIESANITNIDKNVILNINGENLTKASIGEQVFFVREADLEDELLYAYPDYPALKSGLKGIIIKVDDAKISDYEELGKELEKHKPGDKVNIRALVDSEEKEFDINLAENPTNKSKGLVGITVSTLDTTNFRRIMTITTPFRKPYIYYTSTNQDFNEFIYDLLWWVFLINALVALFNMLPVGALDGGRFFLLTIEGITKSEKAAKIVYKIVVRILLFMILLMLAAWLVGLF